MATSFAELETAKPVVKRRSRRMAYIAVVGLCLICGAITVAVLNKRAVVQAERQAVLFSGNQVASQRYADRPGPQITYAQSPYTPNTYTPNTYTPGTYTPYTSTPNAIAPGTYQTAPNSYTQNSALQSGPTGLTYGYSSNPLGVNQPMDPAELTITAEINRLRVQMRSASGEQKQKFRAELDESVSKLFDLRHAAQAKQVEKLEAELAEAKELHKKRGDRKKEIVERRIAELLEAADDLAWNRDLTNGAMTPSAPPLYQPNYNSYANPPISNGSNSYVAPTGSLPSTSPLPGLPSPSTNQIPSSMPPQLLPMNSQEPGRNEWLSESSVSNGDLGRPLSTADSMPASAKSSVSPILNSDQPAQPSLPALPTNKLSDPNLSLGRANAAAFDAGASRSLIKAGYELETALSRVIRTRDLFQQGLATGEVLFDADRAAALAQAIWTNLKSQLRRAEELALKQLVLQQQTLGGVNVSDQVRKESEMEFTRLESEIADLNESSAWAEKFESESLAPLQEEFAKLKQKYAPKPKKESNGADEWAPAEADAVEAKPTAEVDEVKY